MEAEFVLGMQRFEALNKLAPEHLWEHRHWQEELLLRFDPPRVVWRQRVNELRNEIAVKFVESGLPRARQTPETCPEPTLDYTASTPRPERLDGFARRHALQFSAFMDINNNAADDWAKDTRRKLDEKLERQKLKAQVKATHGLPFWNELRALIRAFASALNQESGHDLLSIQRDWDNEMVVRYALDRNLLEIRFDPEAGQLSYTRKDAHDASVHGYLPEQWGVVVGDSGARFQSSVTPYSTEEIAVLMLNTLLGI